MLCSSKTKLSFRLKTLRNVAKMFLERAPELFYYCYCSYYLNVKNLNNTDLENYRFSLKCFCSLGLAWFSILCHLVLLFPYKAFSLGIESFSNRIWARTSWWSVFVFLFSETGNTEAICSFPAANYLKQPHA